MGISRSDILTHFLGRHSKVWGVTGHLWGARGPKGSRDFRLLKLFLLMTRFTSKCRVQELIEMSVPDSKKRRDGNQKGSVT